MGRTTDVTQQDVDEAIASGLAAGHSPPDSEAMKAGRALLGRGARINIARALTVILCNYDLDTDTYWGKVINGNPAEATEPFKDGESVPALRRYPYAARPSYAFQFVLCGEDESVLANIPHDNLVATHGPSGVVVGAPAEAAPVETEEANTEANTAPHSQLSSDERPLWQKLGRFASKQEWQDAGKPKE